MVTLSAGGSHNRQPAAVTSRELGMDGEHHPVLQTEKQAGRDRKHDERDARVEDPPGYRFRKERSQEP
ncbi:hypothetical protein GCM10011313_11970 [Mycetocola zhadangensis]|nr:hypothetical protein GCM10011313_11970 [Mycetocola zhadangensis]